MLRLTIRNLAAKQIMAMRGKTVKDSRPETYKHIMRVQHFLAKVITELLQRSLKHDKSKLEAPELEHFDRVTERLPGLTYGSPEYKATLAEIRPAINHHYQHNRHHPQYHVNGMRDMHLVDLMELVADWKAASERNVGGDVRVSIEENQKKFGYSDDVKALMLNTVDFLEMNEQGN